MKINAKKILIFVFVIISMSLIAAKVKFNKLMGNVYNINDINANIDKMKPGDTINYTGNGYSNWQVLYVDKENKTIDIVTKTAVGAVKIKGKDGLNNAIEILQNEANKYADGENALSARSVAQSDLDNFSYEDKFWTADVNRTSIYCSSGSVELISIDYEYLMPVVTINVDDASNLNVGDEYSYELNGHSSWLVLYINSDTSISIIPKDLKMINSEKEEHCSDLDQNVNALLNEYKKSDNTVRLISSDDINTLDRIQYFKDNVINKYYFSVYADNFSGGYDNGTNIEYYSKLPRKVTRYTYKSLGFSYWGSKTFYISSRACSEFEYTLGIRPIVTVKFSDEKVSQKSLNTNIKIGDNVNYEAKGYNNWKVLSIDEAKGTVDVISGGVVKNVTYTGLEDFNNISTKLQSEVDEYKNGDRVINARIVNFDDFDNLVKINDRTSAKYWTDNINVYKTKYNQYNYYNVSDKRNYSNILNSSVGVGFYDKSIQEIKKEWAILYSNNPNIDNNTLLSPSSSGPYSYMAGIRPVITLKLDEVEKVDESTVIKPADESFVEEQKNINKSSSNILTEKQVQEGKIFSENKSKKIDSSSKTLNNSLDNDYVTENEVDSELNKLYKKYFRKIKFVVLNLLIIDLIIIFVLSILKKIKIYNKK